MVDTVILHVGPHKTGTTALQKALAANVDLLGKHGVIYPVSGRAGESHAALGDALLAGDHTILRALAAETAQSRQVLISTEHLSALGQAALTALRDSFPGAEFRISYALRRLVGLWPSHWAELVKHGQRVSMAGYLERVAQRDDRPYHAPVLPLTQLDRLKNVFGEAALRIFLYDGWVAEGQDIGPAFIDDLLGLGQAASDFATSAMNRSPSEVETALVYLMNIHAGVGANYAAKQRARRWLIDRMRRFPPPDWLAPLTEALDRADRVTLTQDHPLIHAEQAAVARRYGPLLQFPVEAYLMPHLREVPVLETLRLKPGDQAALVRVFDAALAGT